MRYLSLFSGIEAASVAWSTLGWEPVAFSEVEPFPNAVLDHHYPEVPNLGDITQITEADIAALGPIDIVVFGSPCQDLSVAGQREGLSGERSHLFFNAMDIVRWAQRHGGCRWALWENVPGALSANRGADFGSVVGALAGLDDVATPKNRWGKEGAAVGDHGLVEWSVLDAQWFGVAQRRRRVFALADFGDWPNRPPVLLECESLRGNSAPSREPGEGTAGAAGSGAEDGGGDELIPFDTTQITSKWNYSRPQPGQPCHPLAAGAHAPAVAFNARQDPDSWIDRTGPLDTNGRTQAIAYGGNNTRGPIDVATACNANGGSGRMDFETETFCVQSVTGPVTHALPTCNNGKGSSEDGTGRGVPTVAHGLQTDVTPKASEEVSFTLKLPSSGGGGQPAAVQQGMAVRRLTPRECERLQGFPDDFTAIPWRGKPASECPDGPRYKALGNSMAVPVVRWVGERIDTVRRQQYD